MYRRIAQSLLEQVYFRVSALAALDETENILDIRLFSTDFPPETMRVFGDAKEIWLISNHPEGDARPYAQDRRNVDLLVRAADKIPVRLFLCGEDFSCFEVKMPPALQACDIMGENEAQRGADE